MHNNHRVKSLERKTLLDLGVYVCINPSGATSEPNHGIGSETGGKKKYTHKYMQQNDQRNFTLWVNNREHLDSIFFLILLLCDVPEVRKTIENSQIIKCFSKRDYLRKKGVTSFVCATIFFFFCWKERHENREIEREIIQRRYSNKTHRASNQTEMKTIQTGTIYQCEI